MNAKHAAAGLLALLCPLLLFSGCKKLTDRAYSYTAEHTQDYIEDSGGQYLTVENYQGLRSAIMHYITTMSPKGAIRISGYNGNIADDVSEACLDITRNDPIGAFCVDYISHDFSRIVSYYEVDFTFAYCRTPEEVASVIHVYSPEQAKEELTQAYRQRKKTVYLRCYNYDEWGEVLESFFSTAYYELPEYALGMPRVSTAIYPDNGTQRIIEYDLTYSDETEVLLRQAEKMTAKADALISRLHLFYVPDDDASVVQCLKTLCEWMGDNVAYDIASEEKVSVDGNYVKGLAFTPYGALIDNCATSEGFALTVKLVCDRLNIPCLIVQGIRNGMAGNWNIVKIGSFYYQLDSCSFATGENTFLVSDDTLNEEYRWMLSEYPMCGLDWAETVPEETSSAENETQE